MPNESLNAFRVSVGQTLPCEFSFRDKWQESQPCPLDFLSNVLKGEFRATRDDVLMARMLTWMWHELARGPLPLKALATIFGLNERKIQRLFKNILEDSYSSVMNQMRVARAQYYLHTTHFKVGEVARFVGVKNPAQFSHLFRQVTGLTPRHFRKN